MKLCVCVFFNFKPVLCAYLFIRLLCAKTHTHILRGIERAKRFIPWEFLRSSNMIHFCKMQFVWRFTLWTWIVDLFLLLSFFLFFSLISFIFGFYIACVRKNVYTAWATRKKWRRNWLINVRLFGWKVAVSSIIFVLHASVKVVLNSWQRKHLIFYFLCDMCAAHKQQTEYEIEKTKNICTEYNNRLRFRPEKARPFPLLILFFFFFILNTHIYNQTHFMLWHILFNETI